jgi:hypothetical protein
MEIEMKRTSPVVEQRSRACDGHGAGKNLSQDSEFNRLETRNTHEDDLNFWKGTKKKNRT